MLSRSRVQGVAHARSPPPTVHNGLLHIIAEVDNVRHRYTAGSAFEGRITVPGLSYKYPSGRDPRESAAHNVRNLSPAILDMPFYLP